MVYSGEAAGEDCDSARACNEADGNCAIYFPVGIQVAAFCKRLGATVCLK